jgi:hypothetical protein
VQHEYERIQARIPLGIRHLKMDDPRADWSLGRGAAQPETGHPIPGNEGIRVSLSEMDPDVRSNADPA